MDSVNFGGAPQPDMTSAGAPESADPDCDCKVCTTYTRSYVRHLFKAGEHLGARLITYHNLYFFKTLMRKIREAIREDSLEAFHQSFMAAYGDKGSESGV